MIIDRTAIESLVATIGDDPQDLAELIRAFLEDAPDLLGKLRAGAADGDRGAVRRVAHSLKSNARDFGARHLCHLCEALEKDLRGDAEMPDLCARASAILAAWPEVEAALTAEVQGLVAAE